MESVDSQVARLKALGLKRRAETFAGYSRRYPKIGDYHDGAYETDWVSPYTTAAHNVDSRVFLVLHDWLDEGLISGPYRSSSATLGYTPSRTTNQRLEKLLRETYAKAFSDVFITNLWPFVRPSDQNRPPAGDYDRAFRDYCWPQIKIVSTQLVVCLGEPVSKTFSRCLHGPPWGVGNHFEKDGMEIWYQSHPGDRANHATESDMIAAWAEMKAAIDLRTSGQTGAESAAQ